jgi:hypothetical protein
VLVANTTPLSCTKSAPHGFGQCHIGSLRVLAAPMSRTPSTGCPLPRFGRAGEFQALRPTMGQAAGWTSSRTKLGSAIEARWTSPL